MSLPAGWMADRWRAAEAWCCGPGADRGRRWWRLARLPRLPLAAQHGRVPARATASSTPTTTKAGMALVPAATARHRGGAQAGRAASGRRAGRARHAALALAFGWRTAVVLPAALVAVLALVTWLLYREPPTAPQGGTSVAPLSLRMILGHRDLWLVASSTPRLRRLADGADGLPRPVPDRGAAISRWSTRGTTS